MNLRVVFPTYRRAILAAILNRGCQQAGLDEFMKRYHLFEFEDLPWFPSRIRDYMTDYLQFVANQFDFYKPVLPVLEKGLRESGAETVIDLASGGGGGLLKLVEHLEASFPELRVVLTDRYPNAHAFARTMEKHPATFACEPQPVDARAVPEHLRGLRTQFLSLHHFETDDARRILQNAVDAGQPIALFEAQRRNVEHLLRFALSPIAVLVMTPFIRPFTWGRLLFTYLIPVVPFFVFWDGLVSVLRTYSGDEMRAMTAESDGGDRYTWEIGENREGPACIQYLLGYPKE